MVDSLIEELVEPLQEAALAPQQENQSPHIVRDVGGVLPAVAFVEGRLPVAVLLIGIAVRAREGLQPAAIGVAGPDGANLRVPQIHPVLGSFQVFAIFLHVTQGFRHLRNAEVVVSVFHGARGRAGVPEAQVAQPLVLSHFAPFVQRARGVNLGILHHCLIGFLVVDAGQAFGQRVGDQDIAV